MAYSMGLGLVESSPAWEGMDSPPAGAAGKGKGKLDAELVISPDGEVYLHHPTREMLDLASRISDEAAQEEKK
jgi:hypothetical protein